MIQLRSARDRGRGDYGWLDTRHTFSFSEYYDPQHMGFRSLRVMNEDRVAPGGGFGTHAHRDMEIITVVLQGALAHRDSLGNERKILPGEFQCMTAGTGIEHSEFNPSPTEVVHFYQIWILPQRKGLLPGYAQKTFDLEARKGQWLLIASPDGRDESLRINQDAQLWMSRLPMGMQLEYPLTAQRHAWVQVVRGDVTLNGETLQDGDGAAVSEESTLSFKADEDSEVMLFEMG